MSSLSGPIAMPRSEAFDAGFLIWKLLAFAILPPRRVADRAAP
jgi:hypothetical protein